MAVRDIQELKKDILELKNSAGIMVLAHRYQDPDIADVADAAGDCIDLARALHRSESRRAVVCGVRFVAETVALLCPDREVILAHPQARCPMSGQIYPGRVRTWREEHPDTCVVCSVQFTPQLMAECDLCITESNALQVLSASGARKLLLLTDSNLGTWLRERLPDKEIELWPCRCPARNSAQAMDVELCRTKWPDALIAANASLKPEVTQLADMSGSTVQIIEYCMSTEKEVIIADEVSVCAALNRCFPEKGIWQMAHSKLICSNMKITGLETLERTLKGEFGTQITVEPAVARRALVPLRRMLELCGINDFA